jgi:hypothetical protein
MPVREQRRYRAGSIFRETVRSAVSPGLRSIGHRNTEQFD